MSPSYPGVALWLWLAAACAVPDPQQLGSYPDACVVQTDCAPGFDCQERRCLARPGSVCQEGLTAQACERTLGVCAGAQRGCVDAAYEMVCTEASYGPQYESWELSCDGRDNDCDGHADSGNAQLGTFGKLLSFPRGYALLSSRFLGEHNVLTYQLLTSRFEPAGPELILETSSTYLSPEVRAVPYEDGAIVLWSGSESFAGPQSARIAQVVHEAGWGEARMAAGPVSLEGQGEGAPHLALNNEGGRILVAWLDANTVRGQVLSPNLLPLGQGTLLEGMGVDGAPGASLRFPGVAAVGTADFGVSALQTYEGGERAIVFRTVSSTLEPLSELAAYPAPAQGLLDLRVTNSPGGAPVVVWLSEVSRDDGRHVAVDQVRPLSSVEPVRIFEARDYVMHRLSIAINPESELAVAHTVEAANRSPQLTLHLVSAEGQVREQRLEAFTSSSFFHLAWAPTPGRWLASYGFSEPHVFWACAPH